MKTFKIFTKHIEYVVLKCPHCNRIFRYDFRKSRFGQEVKNAKCQRCDKMFDVEKNCLDSDPLHKQWDAEEHFMIRPDGTHEYSEAKTKQELVPSTDVMFEDASSLSKKDL